jgi:phosphatidylglycerophosphatase A
VPDVTDASHQPAAAQRKPRLALFIATACGLGYMPVAPGTWGSLAGLALLAIPAYMFFGSELAFIARNADVGDFFFSGPEGMFNPIAWIYVAILVFISALGVWAATVAASFWRQTDPGRVVIDEVSGQFLTMVLGCGVPVWGQIHELRYATLAPGFIMMRSAVNWKYLLLGFILFRVFDIWKPFPARQAESLPGGWGIMADDWIAGIYAAIGLWIARVAGL